MNNGEELPDVFAMNNGEELPDVFVSIDGKVVGVVKGGLLCSVDEDKEGKHDSQTTFQQEVIELKEMPSVLVTAVRLPSGAIEVITNHQELEKKLKYLNKEYDHDFKLWRNSDVQIVGYLIA